MTREVVFAVPGELDTRTGGYAYDQRMADELRALGWAVRALSLSPAFPFPKPEDLAHAHAAFEAIQPGTRVLVDGLAFGAMADVARRHADRLRLFALVHHPLALETGLDSAQASRLAETERLALRFAEKVIATSAATARALQADFGVEAGRLSVVNPGTDPGPISPGNNEPPVILCVGALVPRKDPSLLVEALAALGDLAWRCRLVGALDRDPATAAMVGAAIAEHGLGERIEVVGEVADVRREMAGADLFVLPSRHEGYGMAFAEALAQGVPVVGCSAGAVPDLVTPEAGRLVPPGDVAALRAAVRMLLSNSELRRSLAEGARRLGARLPSWPQSALALDRILSAAPS